MIHHKTSQKNGRENVHVAVPVAAKQREAASGIRGFSLVELLFVMLIIGVLIIISRSVFEKTRQLANISRATADIRTLEKNINAYFIENGSLPPARAAIAQGDILDPWGNHYVYGNPAALEKGNGSHYNDDFDLYSTGLDGSSQADFDDPTSKDDIVRGGNGGFVGLRY
jgi:general secretion pathway protein G